MQLPGLARTRTGHTFSIWEPVASARAVMGATVAVRAARKRSGFERAAEDPLGARE